MVTEQKTADVRFDSLLPYLPGTEVDSTLLQIEQTLRYERINSCIERFSFGWKILVKGERRDFRSSLLLETTWFVSEHTEHHMICYSCVLLRFLRLY